AAHEGDLVPAADEIAAERAARLLDPGTLDELDEIGRLVVVELVLREEPELHCGGGHALLEVLGVEAEAVPEKFDEVVVAGAVVRLRFHGRSVPLPRALASHTSRRSRGRRARRRDRAC